jgi:hypothetical protein
MLYVNYKHIPFWQDKFLLNTPEGTVEDPWVFVVGILSMHTGINRITRKNAAEFYKRARLVEACYNGGLMQSGKDGSLVGITPEIVERFIGVTTNASSYTEPQFYRHLREDVSVELRRHYEARITVLEDERRAAVHASIATEQG